MEPMSVEEGGGKEDEEETLLVEEVGGVDRGLIYSPKKAG